MNFSALFVPIRKNWRKIFPNDPDRLRNGRKFRRRNHFSPEKKLLLQIKLIALCLLLTVLGYSQRISIQRTNVPLQTIFTDIEKQSRYQFFYNETLLQQTNKVTIDVKNVTVEDALTDCFKNQPLTYAIVDNTIILKKKVDAESSVSAGTLKSTSHISINGKVMGSNKQPIAGATVSVKGTKIATATNAEGAFNLSDVDEKATLIISSVAHLEKEVSVNGQTSLLISLQEKVNDLDEALVVAYNTTTQRSNVGAVTVVKGERIQNLPNRSFDKSLQGLVPGLLVTGGTGQPGGGMSNFVLRGIATAVSPSSASVRNPLIVVDGIPVTQDYFQMYINNPNTPITNPLAQLNPSDIESISVLKDAAAIALYGAKASNGVIVVTTKRGKAGKTSFNFRHQTDFVSVLDGKMELLNGDQYLELVKESYRNYDPALTEADILADLRTKFPTIVNTSGDTSFYPGTNWVNELTREPAVTVSNELSMTGGNDKSAFYLNLEWVKQNGIVKNTGYDRKSIRFNFDNRVASWMKLGMNSTFSYNVQDYGSSLFGLEGPINYFLSPLNPVRLMNGNYALNYNWGGLFSPEANQVAVSEYNTNKNTSYRGLSKIFAEISFLRDFKFISNLGVDYMHAESKELFDPRLFDPGNQTTPGANNAGRIEENSLRRANLITTNILRFDKAINSNHTVNVLAGQEAQIISQKNLGLAVRGITIPYYDQINSPGVSVLRQSGTTIKETLLSYFGQANYSFRNKYFVTGSIRTDGSSRFGEDKRFGTFWSAGAGWIVSSEPFMKGASWLNYLKLRGSVGEAGNAGSINRFTKFDILNYYNYLGNIGLVMDGNSPANNDVKWEETFTWDLGLESRILSDRITITADIYKRRTNDLLYPINIPMSTGFTTILANVGKMDNAGVELSLAGDIIRTKNLKWNIAMNWSTNRNKLVKANVATVSTVTGVLGNKEGENFNSFYLRRWAGVDPANGLPQWIDSTGKPNSSYMASKPEFVGKPQPDGFGAITNTLTFKGFDFQATFTYQYGYQIYDFSEAVNDGKLPYLNQDKRALDRWQKAGDRAKNPRRVLNNVDGGTFHSTRFLFDGDHIRLQNVSLSYNFSRQVLDKLRLNSLRVYLQAYNLAVWTKFPGRDPDIINSSGLSGGAYPNQRSYSIGVSTNF